MCGAVRRAYMLMRIRTPVRHTAYTGGECKERQLWHSLRIDVALHLVEHSTVRDHWHVRLYE